MWSSEPANRRFSFGSGFTLLELMMVLLLIGLLLGVGLTLDFAGSPQSQQQQAQQLAEQYRLAAEEAVLSGNVWALDFFRLPARTGAAEANGYRWLYHDGKQWQPAEPKVLDAETNEFLLPPGQSWQLTVNGAVLQPGLQQALLAAGGRANTAFAPAVLLLPTRESTAFAVEWCDNTHGCSAALTVDALGRAVVKNNEDK